QEAGRAGRDGLPAECLLLWSPADRDLQSFFIEQYSPGADSEPKQNAYARLAQMLSYAQLRSCRHARIGDYFGEEGVPRRCTACDNCLSEGPAEVAVDAGLVRAALAVIRRLNGRVGAANIAAVLGGRETKWVREHDWARQVTGFGALADWSQERIRLLLAELLEAG